MFESTPFLSLTRRLTADDYVADDRLVALVNESRSDDERIAFGRSATARVQFARRRKARRGDSAASAKRFRR